MGGPRRQDDVVIRGRTGTDDDAIRRVNDAAFGGTAESKLVEDLRAAGLAAVELVAIDECVVIGHILFSELTVMLDEDVVPALSLAPLSVRPGRQKSGIGSALVRAGLDLAKNGGWHAVIVLGHPDYYPRFGFSASCARHLEAPFSGDAFMALELVAGALAGDGRQVRYPPPFGIA